jgi:hypothetical protein
MFDHIEKVSPGLARRMAGCGGLQQNNHPDNAMLAAVNSLRKEGGR